MSSVPTQIQGNDAAEEHHAMKFGSNVRLKARVDVTGAEGAPQGPYPEDKAP
jgi:hypothetical protein